MQTDMNERLMQQQKSSNMTFDQLQQRMEGQLQAFTAKNQNLQKKADAENDQQFLKNFNQLKSQMQSEMQSMNLTLSNLQEKGKTTAQKRTVKKLSTDYNQQYEKFTRSVKKIINSSFSQRSLSGQRTLTGQRSTTNRDQNGSIDSENGMIAERSDSEFSQQDDEEKQRQQQKQIQQQKQNQQWETDLEMDKVLLQEKEEELTRFEQDMVQINQNFTNMVDMINKQGEGIDEIQENAFVANQNVIKAHSEIVSADEIQRKSKKKYIIFAVIILIALGAVLAVVFTQM